LEFSPHRFSVKLPFNTSNTNKKEALNRRPATIIQLNNIKSTRHTHDLHYPCTGWYSPNPINMAFISQNKIKLCTIIIEQIVRITTEKMDRKSSTYMPPAQTPYFPDLHWLLCCYQPADN
jgi:hypothetical protein